MVLDRKVKAMVIGGGGREHAICWKLAQSPCLERLYCAPGNGGTASLEKTENVDIKVGDFDGITAFAKNNAVDLIIIGPDNPLADGIVDHLHKAGLRVFGPRQAAARLESSKAFAKDFMVQQGIPTAKHFTTDSHEDACSFVRENEWARVVKVDGLALGKGVFVCDNLTETLDALQIIFRENRFGESGRQVVLEERLIGEEMSLLMFCDGKTLSLMPPSQDHKRRFEGDRGPNTGGMGVFAPVDLYQKCREVIDRDVVAPLQKALDSRRIDYNGIIYAGLLMVSTPEGYKPYVLEFNARFGDPETQVILPLLQSDLLEIMWASTEGKLAECKIEWSNQSACCVIACAEAYPEGSSKDEPIIIGHLNDGTIVFHAGTKLQGDKLLSAGGRVLGITSLGANLNEAINRAYEGIKSISFKDMAYRKDIGRRALSGCP
jgi:phosphoribosylamine--glycine ligase